MATSVTLAGCVIISVLLIVQISAQPNNGATQTIDGVTYTYYDGPLTWEAAKTGCLTGGLAVLNDKDTHKRVVEWLFGAPMNGGGQATGTPFSLWLGLKKNEYEVNIRTYPGGRILTHSNLWATGANITEDACVKMVLDPDNEPFMYYNTWQTDLCDDLNAVFPYLCMNKRDESCTDPKDACGGVVSNECKGRSLSDQCVWAGPEIPLQKTDAVALCEKNGGQIISIYNNGDLSKFKQLYLQFSVFQPWNAVWTNIQQKPGEAAPRYPDGCVVTEPDLFDSPTSFTYELLNLLQTTPRDVHYGSSLSASGWTIVYFPYFDKWNLYNDAAWNLVDIFFIEYLRGGSRIPFFAFTVCEAPKDDYCMFNTPEVKNAEKEKIIGDQIIYKCKENYEFSDGSNYQYKSCGCNITELEALSEMLSKGCQPKNPCISDSKNNCDQICTPSTSHSNGYQCSCKNGYQLQDDEHSCEDVDECKEDPDRCQLGQYGHCKNIAGSYSCFCQPGFAFGASGECVADQPKVTPGKFEVSFKLPPCVGKHQEMEVQQSLSASVYDIVTQQEFDDMVTVTDIAVSGSGTMTVVLNIGGAVKQSDHATYANFFAAALRTQGLQTIDGNKCKIASAFYDAESVSRAVELEDACSVYNAIQYCSVYSECVSEDDKPKCRCDEGYDGERCDLKTEEPPPSLSLELIIIISVIVVLFCIVIVLLVMVCRLYSVHSPAAIIPPPVSADPIYGGTYGPLPRPILGNGLPGMRRRPMPPVTLPPPGPPPIKPVMPPLDPFSRGPGMPRRRMLPFFGRR